MSVLSEIRRLPGVISDLAVAVLLIAEALKAFIELRVHDGGSEERLQELERTRAMWEAEMEALQVKADSTLKSASNAESRSRTMLRHAEKLADPLDFEGEEIEAAVPAGHAPGGEEEGLQPVHLGVAPSHKELALRHKFG